MDYRTCQNGEILSLKDVDANLTFDASAVTSVGMVRDNNEDSVQLWAFDDSILGLVADGMGGAAGGEEASRLTVETLQMDFIESIPAGETLVKLNETTLAEKLRTVLGQANRAVLNRAALDHNLQGMGTTATLVMVRKTRAIFAHIGDSRAYLVDGFTQKIYQVTSDHSFVEALVSQGLITPEQAATHPLRNVLYKALGQKDEAEADIDIYERSLKPSDRLILCSDGLTRHVSDEDIASRAMGSNKPNVIAQELVDLANERGGEDNISAVVIVVKSAQE